MADFAKWYRRLLRFYPASFREEYEGPMYRQFRDEERDAEGWKDRAGLWIRALGDIAVSVPREVAKELGQDLHYAFRVWRKRPLSTAIAMGTLALAIGASTGVFSIASGLLLRSLPFAEPARLVELRWGPFTAGMGHAGFREWRQRSAYLQDAATFSVSEMNLNSGRDALRVRVAESSSNLFALLGVTSYEGRSFAAGEDKTGENRVAVISHRMWLQAFGGDPAAIGATIHLDGSAFSIIGVAPPRFDYPGNIDVWTPTVFDFETIPKQGAFLFETIGRLKSGITLAQARQMFAAEVAHVNGFRPDDHARPELVGLRDQLSSQIRQSVLVLSALVLLVLLAACANVAQLLLSVAGDRRAELALRSALGASRGRILQQLTVEATALTLAGCALGMVLALFVCRAASVILPAPLATQNYTLLDWRVLCFAVALALMTGAVFGVMPAWLLGRIQPSTHAIGKQPGGSRPLAGRLRAILVGLQVAFTLSLLVSSFALCEAFLRLAHTDLGFEPANVVTLNVSLEGTQYRSGNSRWQYYSALRERLLAIPGATGAGAVNYLPLTHNMLMAGSIEAEHGAKVSGVVLNGAMPGYFRAMGTKVIAGREFDESAADLAEPTVIVNEAFARQAGLGADVVGQRIIAPWTKRPYVVRGMVATARMGGPEHDGGPQVYWSVKEEPPPALTFVVSVRGDAQDYLARCRDAAIGLDRTVTVYDVGTLEQRLNAALEQPRFYMSTVVFLAGLTLLIAIAGVYSASSRAITQRAHELGVRVALGASMGNVRALILRQSLAPVVAGIAAGTAGAAGCGLLVEHLFTGAQGPGAAAFLVTSFALIAVAAGTAWSATTRVLAIDPIEAIRAE